MRARYVNDKYVGSTCFLYMYILYNIHNNISYHICNVYTKICVIGFTFKFSKTGNSCYYTHYYYYIILTTRQHALLCFI